MWSKRPQWMSGRTFNFEFIDKQMTRTAENLEELTNTVMQLPAVDEDGYSECPFIDQLYDDKDRALAKVRNNLSDLEKSLAKINLEFQEQNRNLTEVRKASDAIDEERAAHKLSFGEISQEFFSKHTKYKKQVLEDLIAFSKKYIRLADSANIPRSKSRHTSSKEKDDWEDKSFNEKAIPENENVQKDDFADTHIDQLVDLGPLP